MDDDDSLEEDRSLFGYSTGLGGLADFGELGEPERSAGRAKPPRTTAFAALRARVVKAAAEEMARRRNGGR